MALVQILPVVSLIGMVALVVSATFTDLMKSRAFLWFWVVYAVGFGAFSLFAIAEDGLVSFWTNHTANWIGNQVWADLVFALAIGWILVLPEARRRDMNIWFWLNVVLGTATVGFAAMIARLLYLRAQDTA